MKEVNAVVPVFNLNSSLTIAEVTGLKQAMLDLYKSSDLLTLDGSEIEHVDGAGVQLLAAFVKEAAERRIDIRWSGASERLQSAVLQLGLDMVLDLKVKA